MDIKRVLIVDDDESILEALTIAIESVGHEVRSTCRGEDVIGILDTFAADVVLLDLLLSGMDGSDIVRDMKNRAAMKDIPIILLSAHPSVGQTAKDCGADNFLPKPFDLDILLDLINNSTKGKFKAKQIAP